MKLENIYTGNGDYGETSFLFEKGSKDHILILANQFINIFNIKLGYLYGKGFDSYIDKIQDDLVIIMGQVISSRTKKSLNNYKEKFGELTDEIIKERKEFLNYVKEQNIELNGWTKYNSIDSLPFFECCEFCRAAEIFLVDASKNHNCFIDDCILEYFNYINKMIFMMGIIYERKLKSH